MRRRRMSVLVALAVVLTTRVVYAAPVQAQAELRAVGHCTQHTGRPVSVPAARQCCHVGAEATSPLASTAVPTTAANTATAVLLPAPISAGPSGAGIRLEPRRYSRDGPPLYLGLRTIRC